jgi:hypothetical protein
MSTAPFQTGPETTYEPQNQSMSQTTLPVETQEQLAEKVHNGGGSGSTIAEKVTQDRAEGLEEQRAQGQTK